MVYIHLLKGPVVHRSSKISLGGGGGGGAGRAAKHTEPSLLANSILIQHWINIIL
jgi:hypothetical protein